jgi:tetratricopeptide (TPR) repeat protein
VLLVAPSVLADTKLEKARAHYQAGEAAFQAGDYDRAIMEFSAAYELSPRPVLLFNLGAAYRRRAESQHYLADLRQALEDYQRYLEAEPNGKGADDARAYVAILQKEIEARSAPPPVEPSPQLPVPAPPPALAPPPSAVATPPARDEPIVEDAHRSFRIAGLASAGVGVALVGAGVFFALQARSLDADLGALAGRWDQDLYDRAHAAQRNAVIGLAGGGVAIAGGAVLYFVLGRPAPVAVQPTGSGLAVSGRF